jgi:hypothetical protein
LVVRKSEAGAIPAFSVYKRPCGVGNCGGAEKVGTPSLNGGEYVFSHLFNSAKFVSSADKSSQSSELVTMTDWPGLNP